jgi:hypothetical protein
MNIWIVINQDYLSEVELKLYSDRDIAIEHINEEYPDYNEQSKHFWVDGLSYVKLTSLPLNMSDNLQNWQKDILELTKADDLPDIFK